MKSSQGNTQPAIPRTVWALGLVSLLMDTSSEIVHSLLPLFLTMELGLTVAMVGLIDGVAESTAALTKLVSGYISDRVGRRKPLILLGYGLAAFTKPVFALAGSAGLVFAARFADRIGKGLRGAPRDALVTDVTPPEIRGRAFGLRQSLDTVGAFAGPLIAVALMATLANDMRSIFWIATIPAVFAVGLIIFGVSEPQPMTDRSHRGPPLTIADLRRLPRAFWMIVLFGLLLTLARFSEAFLVLKANGEGLPLVLAPLVLVVMNLVYATGAYPAGKLSDSMPASRLLAIGIVFLIAADLAFALLPGLGGVAIGLILWGMHMAMTQGLLTRLVADFAPSDLRGSAFGMFNLATGIALFVASVVAGLLWDRFGPSATFFAGASFAAVALLLLSRYPQSSPS